MSTYIPVYIEGYMSTCIFAHIPVYIRIHICIYVYNCIHTCYTYNYIYFIYVYTFFQILFPYRLLQNIEYNFLCSALGPCWLSILYICIYMLIPNSLIWQACSQQTNDTWRKLKGCMSVPETRALFLSPFSQRPLPLQPFLPLTQFGHWKTFWKHTYSLSLSGWKLESKQKRLLLGTRKPLSVRSIKFFEWELRNVVKWLPWGVGEESRPQLLCLLSLGWWQTINDISQHMNSLFLLKYQVPWYIIEKNQHNIWQILLLHLFISFFNNDSYFFHYSWFTVFCQFSTVQQGDPVTHTCIHSFFSHYHALSWVTIVPSATQQDCIAYAKAIVCIY